MDGPTARMSTYSKAHDAASRTGPGHATKLNLHIDAISDDANGAGGHHSIE